MENWELKIWKEFKASDGLFDLLMKLTKDDMTGICKELRIKGVSSLKKVELAKRLTEKIPLYFPVFLRYIDSKRYRMIKAACDNGGMLTIPYEETDELDCIALSTYGLSFLSRVDEIKLLLVPEELISIFKEVDDTKLAEKLKKNDRTLAIMRGMLYHYGVVSMESISEFIYHLVNDEDEMFELMLLLKVTIFNNNGLDLDEGFVVSEQIENPDHIIKEQQMRSDLKYKHFSQKELIKAGQTDYIDSNQYTDKIRKTIREFYEVKGDLLDDIIFDLLDIIRQDEPLKEGLQYISEVLGVPELSFMKQYSQAFIQLYNNTSKWVLKGHTSIELRPNVKPFKTKPAGGQPEKAGKVLEFKRKIGRNEPCPCGSGKKHKHCCGNT